MYHFFTEGGGGSTVLAPEVDIIPPEMDVARLFEQASKRELCSVKSTALFLKGSVYWIVKNLRTRGAEIPKRSTR